MADLSFADNRKMKVHNNSKNCDTCSEGDSVAVAG